MREFDAGGGDLWVARVRERPGNDYKGRYFFWVEPREGGGEGVALLDVRWNSERTARRTLATMSEVELRRRWRSARGRGTPLRAASAGAG
jgi:hypothetical protein